MQILIKNGQVYYQNKLQKKDLLIRNQRIKLIRDHINQKAKTTINARGLVVLPGLIDIHTHLREPGYEYKETIETGARAAAKGGYTTICCMPNTRPIIDSKKNLDLVNKIIKVSARINVLPYSAITINEVGKQLVDIKSNAKYCFAFSDDGVGVQSSKLMEQAMRACRRIKRTIVAHCESFVNEKSIEHIEVKRNIDLSLKTQCHLHICHVSEPESIQYIKYAKQRSSLISCEVTPHHLLLNPNKRNGIYKVNPPLVDDSSRKVLLRALIDGTIDLIACDHAPHSITEKTKPYSCAANGIVGLETSFALMYTNFVKTKIVSLTKLINLMSLNVSKLFSNLPNNDIKLNNIANITLVDLKQRWKIEASQFVSKCHVSPFDKQNVYGVVKYTICNGKIVYKQ